MLVCPACRAVYVAPLSQCRRDQTTLVDQDEDPLIGQSLERYLILEQLGRGAMGFVYRAGHEVIDRQRAIKVLFGDFATDPPFLERFRREAHAASMVKHPNIVSITDFGHTKQGLAFLVMELVEGETLQKLIRRDAPLEPERAARILRQIAEALGEAHSLGFVHRDMKPANVMITTVDGREYVKVLDFGLVRGAFFGDSQLTIDDMLIGTPAYMAPEQAEEPNVGPEADLYSLGVVLFEMLEGRLPFRGNGMASLVRKLQQDAPPARPSRGLEALAASMLQRNPAARPRSAADVIRRLDGLGIDRPIWAPPAGDRRHAIIDFPSVTNPPEPRTDPSVPPLGGSEFDEETEGGPTR